MRYLRTIGDLDTAEAMLARHFNAFAEAPVCTYHSRTQVLGVAEPTKRRCLQLGGVGLARQLQAALVLADAALDVAEREVEVPPEVP